MEYPFFCTRATVATLLLSVLVAVPLPSQVLGDATMRSHDMMEMQQRSHQPGIAARDAAQREQEKRMQFRQRARDFEDAWKALMDNDGKGVWNAKQAKSVRKAFERLVHSEGWVENSK